MKQIYKYPLELTDTQEIEMPYGAKILSCQYQNQILCVWAEVDTDKPVEGRVFQIVGTGFTAPQGMFFVATAIQRETYVWHIYTNLRYE